MELDRGNDAQRTENVAPGVRLRAGPRRLYRQALPSLWYIDYRAGRLAALRLRRVG